MIENDHLDITVKCKVKGPLGVAVEMMMKEFLKPRRFRNRARSV